MFVLSNNNKQLEKMLTLQLNRKQKGIYSKRVGNILVQVQQLPNGDWQGTIEEHIENVKDRFTGRDVEMVIDLIEPYYGKTKKEVYEVLTKEIERIL